MRPGGVRSGNYDSERGEPTGSLSSRQTCRITHRCSAMLSVLAKPDVSIESRRLYVLYQLNAAKLECVSVRSLWATCSSTACVII